MEAAINLLKALIETPSFSKEEDKTTMLIQEFLAKNDIAFQTHLNNVWATNKLFNNDLPTILLNSHHDTVKPNKGYTNDPFKAIEKDGKLYGLGSNDAGGCLVSLLYTFIHFYEQNDLTYNLVFAATAEEEISGKNGIAAILNKLPKIDFAIVGEPTEMNLAIAEKGLLVIDATAKGVSGHAANYNTVNPIGIALEDINWINNYVFPKVSEVLGEVKMSVTQINAGTQHNVVPEKCAFVIDVRVNEKYSNQEVFDLIDNHTKSSLKARSFRLNSSGIAQDHPIVKAAQKMRCKIYGSPTLSDQALMPFDSVKIGAGKSERSHSADEFIFIDEVKEGIEKYIQLISILNGDSSL